MPALWKAALAAPFLMSADMPAHGPIFAGMPPERFQGEAVVITFFVDDVTPFCGTAAPGFKIIACQRKIKDTPVLILPNPCPLGDTEYFARIACHEIAHHRGWGGNHEL